MMFQLLAKLLSHPFNRMSLEHWQQIIFCEGCFRQGDRNEKVTHPDREERFLGMRHRHNPANTYSNA